MKQASVLENQMSKDSKVLRATAESLQQSITEKDSELSEMKDQAKTLKDNLANLEKLY
jgi:hypothetical protein